MRSLLLMGSSFVLTTAVIGNAFYQKQQFYPSVVYITKSNPSMAVMYIQALVFVVLAGKVLRAVFFGQLRAAEMEHLIERSWYAVTETCLAFTVFRDDFSPRFVALFTLLLFLKCFHWLAEDRVDYMERSPAISWLFHVRALSLMFVLGLLDILFVRHAFESTMSKGPSVQLVFGFEYEILFTVVLMTFIKYVLHTIDMRNQNPWDNKAVYLLYSELIMGLIRVILYLAFVCIMIKVHTFPLFAIRPMYLAVRAFQKAAQDVVLSRRAIRNMNTLYPDATAEELSAGDNVCIICREEMITGCKKLPCNHIFHTSCLRSWFQRQQSCPTCRLEVLRMPRPAPAQAAGAAQPPQPPAQQQPQVEPVPNPFQNMFGGMPFQWPPNFGGQALPPFMWQPPPAPPAAAAAAAPAQQQQQEQGVAAGQTPTAAAAAARQGPQPDSTSGATSAPTTSTSAATAPPPSLPGFPPFMPPLSPYMPHLPPYMPMMSPMFPPFGFPPAPIPTAGLSEEELLLMEGMERSNIEARIQWLQDIQALLDGAMVLIHQYNTVSSHVGVSNITLAGRSQAAPHASRSRSDLLQQTQGSSWWPENSGARPKYTSTTAKTETTDSPRGRTSSSEQVPDADSVLGATGGPPAPDEVIPDWSSSRDEEQGDMCEVRKRRLQYLSQLSNNAPSQSVCSSSEKQNGAPSSSLKDNVEDREEKH